MVIQVFCFGLIIGAMILFWVWFFAREIRLKNEYIASLDDKQARKYLEFGKKVYFGIE